MFNLKKVMVGAVAAFALVLSVPGHANNNIDGVSWDPNSVVPPDFGTSGSSSVRWFSSSSTIANAFSGNAPTATTIVPGLATTGDYFYGIGLVDTMNGSSTFCSGCQLVFVMTGFKLLNSVSTASGAPVMDNGKISFYVVPGASTIPTTGTTAYGPLSTITSSPLFLELTAVDNGGSSRPFTNVKNFNAANNPSTNDFVGYFQATGGDAKDAFDTNTRPLCGDLYSFNQCHDIGGVVLDQWDVTFALKDTQNVFSGDTLFTRSESQGDTKNVPEPGSLALMGLALVGLGALRRRRAIAA